MLHLLDMLSYMKVPAFSLTLQSRAVETPHSIKLPGWMSQVQLGVDQCGAHGVAFAQFSRILPAPVFPNSH